MAADAWLCRENMTKFGRHGMGFFYWWRARLSSPELISKLG